MHKQFTSVLGLCTVSVACALMLGGCGNHFTIEHPSGFVELEEENSLYNERSTNAHGAVIAVRELENDPQGDLGFWVDAIKNRLRVHGGYALLSEEDVAAPTGQTGHQLRFGRDQNGHQFHYWVTVFVTESYIHLVEAGGRDEVFTDVEEQIASAVASLRIE